MRMLSKTPVPYYAGNMPTKSFLMFDPSDGTECSNPDNIYPYLNNRWLVKAGACLFSYTDPETDSADAS